MTFNAKGCCCGCVHTLCLSDDGIVHSFGFNLYGQLGVDTLGASIAELPLEIKFENRIVQISCGQFMSLCLDENGIIWSFGSNTSGQLGLNHLDDEKIPKQILNIPTAIKICCGASHVLFIDENSNLWSFGSNTNGALCLEKEEIELEYSLKPEKTKYSNVLNISAGNNFSIFQIDNNFYSCGCNSSGQLGIGLFNNNQIIPTQIEKIPSNVIYYNCGWAHVLFLTDDGVVFSVGYNFSGQLGIGNEENQSTLCEISNIPPIQCISAQYYHSLCIDIDLNLWVFGFNNFGQLGLKNVDKNSIFNTPQKSDLSQVTNICDGLGSHTVLKTSNGSIFSFGFNDKGQLGLGKRQLLTPGTLGCLEESYNYIFGSHIFRAKSARK